MSDDQATPAAAQRPTSPVVGYDRFTNVPLCQHGDDAEACQLTHYRVARCGQLSTHGPHVVEHGPDQPRNCPGTGHTAGCVAGVVCEPYCDAIDDLPPNAGRAS